MKEKLLRQGYRRFKQPEDEPTLYQKKVSDKKGTKYFINCYHYLFPERPPMKDGWEFKLQIDSDIGTVNITLFNLKKCTIKRMEGFMEKMWIQQGYKYYEEFVLSESGD